ncbi:hypothetical protein [Pararhizobium arenae]|jgi:hypothetical protein|uniref:hypothetical protein n=1 Tax=Pararhizobium arenae TaxID=1856850 RepID=UPI000AA89DFB|nr:hypothetical protein [Pararhizobium arenae]
MRLPLPFGGALYVKSARRLKWVEDKRQVPMVIVAGLCISYWTRSTLDWDRRHEESARKLQRASL